MLVQTEKMNMLLDFYDVLLTDKQKEIMNEYFREDLSLNEIAENRSISKAAVYDLIKRCEKILNLYEDKLHLVRKYKKRNIIYQDMLKYNSHEINDLVKKCIDIETMED